jgi:hypothetical protein
LPCCAQSSTGAVRGLLEFRIRPGELRFVARFEQNSAE